MKKILILLMVLSFYANSKAQVSQMIKSKIGYELQKLNDTKYKGNVTLSDYKELDGKSYIVIGQFDWEASYAIGGKSMEKRKFKALVKVIFDEIEVTKLTWEKQYFWPYEGTVKECHFIVGEDSNNTYKMCSFDSL